MQRRQALSALALLAGAAPAYAQAYPSKPVKIIVPAPPGGTADIFARALGQRMQAAMGQPFVVEYKPGAATNIGTDFVAKSAPDGYTVLFNGITLASNPALFAKLPFNPATDLAPIIEVASMVNVITVHPSVPAQTLRELVQMARNAPGTINHGSPGIGSSGHLAGELLAHRTGIKLTHVPYQGLAPATNDHERFRAQWLVWPARSSAHAARNHRAAASRSRQGLARPGLHRDHQDRRRRGHRRQHR
jgi:tripartite-type tricarboxylate transporter receptor subunit TctC